VSCIRQRSQDKIGEYLLLYLHLSRDESLPSRGEKLARWLVREELGGGGAREGYRSDLYSSSLGNPVQQWDTACQYVHLDISGRDT
jgi:hypothetical protein